MLQTFVNTNALIGGKLKKNCNISVENGKIVAIGNQTLGETMDCGENICCAGFIDIHSHGGWGKDCMEASIEAIETICKYHLSTGITSFVPTTMTASPRDINSAVDNLRKYSSKYARVVGAHLEGPYLSEKAAGAHPKNLLLNPTDDNQSFVWNNLDMIKRITLAPNLENSGNFCKKATEHGIQISLGHDNSIDDEINDCIDNGATSVTHMYNCTSRPSRRQNPKKHLGLTEIGLIDKSLVCEVIADNRHVPNALFGMIYKLKGWENICLVSDSLSVAGMPQGTYYLGNGESKQAIAVEDGVAVLPSKNTYAGSITTISKMARDLRALGYAEQECLSMASLVPSRLLKLSDRGDIKVGMLADLNFLDNDLNILATYLGGEKVDAKVLSTKN